MPALNAPGQIIFTATGSWVCPNGVNFINVEAWGGGGSGGNTSGSASGGGGGAYARTANIPVTPGTSYTVTVGTGGVSQTIEGAGNAGNDSGFNDNSLILAKGGTAGKISAGTAASATGGASASCVGDVKFSGGNSGTGTLGGASGGGGGAGDSAVGGNSSNASSNGTAGATGGTVNGGNGSAGSNVGASSAGSVRGGGSGGSANGPASSGAGARGEVRITLQSPITTIRNMLRPRAFSPGIAR